MLLTLCVCAGVGVCVCVCVIFTLIGIVFTFFITFCLRRKFLLSK